MGTEECNEIITYQYLAAISVTYGNHVQQGYNCLEVLS